MNEQIRELEKQCWSHYVNGVLIDGHLHFDTQKFAELIVQECVGLCQESIDDGCVEAEEPMRKIEKHFGVES